MDLREDRKVQSTFLEVYMITLRFDMGKGKKIRNSKVLSPAWAANLLNDWENPLTSPSHM